MRLSVIHRAGAYYRGRRYAKDETFEIDETGHNGAAEIRYLVALKKVEPIKVEPVGLVASTQPAPQPELGLEPARAPDVAPEPQAVPPPAEPGEPTRGRGRYQRRDLRAQD